MKKIIFTLLTFFAITANAHYPNPYHYRPHCCGWGGGWLAPAIITGVIGYEIARSQQPVIVQQPVYVEPQTVYPQAPIIQQPPTGYHWQEMIDPATNTRKIVLVPN